MEHKITCPTCNATIDVNNIILDDFVPRDEYEEAVEELETLKNSMRNNVSVICDEEIASTIQDGIERQNDINSNR